MRWCSSVAVALAALVTTGAAVAAQVPKPQHVMSLNLCTDQILLMLLPKERIVSVSFLSRAAEKPYIAADALGVPINYGTLEEVLVEKPDLVIAGTASTPTTRSFLKAADIPLAEVPLANSFDEIRATTRLLARAVGEEEKAETLLAKMDATLAELAANAPKRAIVVAGWGGGGELLGKGTLFDAILSAAGGMNVASSVRNTRFGAFDFEQLLDSHPDIIAFGDSTSTEPGLRREQIHHPLVESLYRSRQIAYPEALFACGLPQSADAAKSMQRAMLDIMAKASPP